MWKNSFCQVIIKVHAKENSFFSALRWRWRWPCCCKQSYISRCTFSVFARGRHAVWLCQPITHRGEVCCLRLLCFHYSKYVYWCNKLTDCLNRYTLLAACCYSSVIFLPRVAILARYVLGPCVRLSASVCLSVTSRGFINTAKHRIAQTKPHDSLLHVGRASVLTRVRGIYRLRQWER